ncbi:hypothetical protein I6Y99_004968 [Vibrio parahaemolyticus]|uniref:hypothetical protein n=2 Tax=Vibrio parahaemolyticus TaxID=670 RepID=UPI0011243B66|nr:hypothetical protein [Vibrio parahaemolyticus]EGQ7810900.1 hypothetical protein [Vibrio parahaemolyticus]EJG1118563.1 hypothetical protein [Vibrio parahaemolyticus]MBM4982813.1 hypothetical protein [Vibrio parahaemolyticus]TOI47789.1 hypothetical protein CGI59_23720 [Vibrio parahaemolyticus]
MTVEQWISLSASIGACLSAIAALFAVKLSSKHSSASYKPELVISRKSFYSAITTSMPKEWSEMDVSESNESYRRNSFTIPLSNVGLGAAKQIEVNWSFPIDSTVKSINTITQKNHIPSYFKYENEILSFETEGDNKSVSMWVNQKSNKLDFVLPSSVETTPTELLLPPAYSELISAWIYFHFKSDKKEQFPEFPMIKAKVTFFDIGGKKHTCKFEISSKIVIVANDGSKFQGYIESKNA